MTRFEAKVDKSEHGCWLWTGASNGRGYGSLHVDGRTVRAHRVSWELHCGPIPDGLLVLHHCNNSYCVKPDHLYLGDASDNAQDRVRAGTLAGDRNGSAKLTRDEVRAMVMLSKQGGSTPQLALDFGTSYPNAWAIVNGKSRALDTRDLWEPVLPIAA